MQDLKVQYCLSILLSKYFLKKNQSQRLNYYLNTSVLSPSNYPMAAAHCQCVAESTSKSGAYMVAGKGKRAINKCASLIACLCDIVQV